MSNPHEHTFSGGEATHLSDIGISFYQKRAINTAVFSEPEYPLMALAEEVGEVMGKLAKFSRKNNIGIQEILKTLDEGYMCVLREDLKKEMGDVLWQWAVLCNVMGFDAHEVALSNLAKLQDRQQRNVLDGEGDNR